ncbi:uncharacterized protein LOC123316928 [Coccinella septempunctata]|uniref:uncharacterized protein LOC123316928 n=1 Tax=Coccinella septempunctata TaxID=41139 RepID=UPI001D07476B|nr:uncharacterized protein LOC123316928 [Coccinella septempunctata]
MSDSENDVPSDIEEAAQSELSTIIPKKSRSKNDLAYAKFGLWFALGSWTNKKYTNLLDFLKGHSEGYQPKKTKVFSKENIANFLKKGCDEQRLMHKEEFAEVTIPNTKTNVCREFAIDRWSF